MIPQVGMEVDMDEITNNTDAIEAAQCECCAAEGEERSPCECCSGKRKERSEKERRELLNRLRRIEGQVRGVANMLEKDTYCTDILMQVTAISAALNSFSKVLLASHVRSCVAEDIRAGNDDTIDELVFLLQKLMK